MDQEKHQFYYKLDFLYQSIAVYAVTLVVYLLARSFFAPKEFPVVGQDPVLYLLCAITLISVFALLYNLLLRRRIVIEDDKLHFISSLREHVVLKSDIRYMRFARERRMHTPATRVVKIRLKSRRRPIRIRPFNYQDSSKLIRLLKDWAGPLAQSRVRKHSGNDLKNGLGSVGRP